MRSSLARLTAQLNREYRQRGRRRLLLSALSLFVLLATLSGMLLPAFTQEKTVYCGLEEHVHGADCYERVLRCGLEENAGHQHGEDCYESEVLYTCGLEESEGHQHGEDCYTAERFLTCGLPENEEHTHGDSCYTWERRLVCTQEESEGHRHDESCTETVRRLVCGREESPAHVHTDECFETRLVCGLPEHTHSLACYSDPGAVESEALWKRSFPTFGEETPAERLTAIAASQLGYHESAENYRVTDDGQVQGYTRYGAWCGDPYGDWCAMFVSFCLHYAGIGEDAFPCNRDCACWVDELRERELYAPAADAAPRAGDVIFFDLNGDGLADHAGLVCLANAESGTLDVIDGDYADAVERRSHALSDPCILGWGLLPETLRISGTEDAPEQTPVPAATEEIDAGAWPAQHFCAELNGLTVAVDADAGAFPANTAMSVRPVPSEQVLDAVNNAVEGRVVWVQAVDISFYNEAMEEIQPRLPIRVSILSEKLSDEEQEETEIVHVDAEGAARRVEQAAVPAAALNEVAFEADSFSIYALVRTVIETHIQSGDGSSYLISVSYGPEAGIPEDAELAVSEIRQIEEAVDGATVYESYLAKTREALDAAGLIEYARFFDIRIVSGGEAVQPVPGSTVNVTIRLEDSQSDSLSVVHFGEEPEIVRNTAEEGTVSFAASGFSVYAIVDAPEPIPSSGWNRVATLEEFAEHAAEGFYIHHPNGYYLKNTQYVVSGSRTGIEKTGVISSPAAAVDGGAVKYRFEQIEGTSDQFRARCLDGSGNVRYVRQAANSLSLVPTEAEATVFTVSAFPGESNTFRVEGTGGYFWNMQGGVKGRGFAAYNNATDENARLVFEYYFQAEQADDPYGLNGKTYGIAYHDNAATAAALTAEAMESGGQQRFRGQDMIMKPDVRDGGDHSGVLLVLNGSDIQKWTFESIEENRYYLTTVYEGEIRYLSIDGGNVALRSEADESCVVSATPGVGANAGKWHFTVNGFSLNLQDGKSANGFNGAAGDGSTSWMNLVEDAPVDDDAFTLYQAKKISVSDTEELNGQGDEKSQVILYTRIWNETKKRYEFFAVDHDGGLIPCYDVGDGIEWVGSKVNAALWEFTEYTNEDGTPNYYYELQNVQYGSYLAPQLAADQIMSDDTVGINLNGRRNGEAYTTIIAWDDTQYAYSGLKTENGRVVVCPLAEAEHFYFAIVKPAESPGELSTVATLDNNEYGIVMKMIDYNNEKTNTPQSPRDKEQSRVLGKDTNVAGLLSTNLGEDGYPVTTAAAGSAGTSLKELYTGTAGQPMTDANHLFLASIHQESGYFEYDSTSNFAHLESSGNFTVYNQLGTIGDYNSMTAYHGQFMPYDNIVDRPLCDDDLHRNTTDVLAHELPDTHPRKGEALYDLGRRNEVDYHFGMEMTASFTQTTDGLDDWGHDIIFEFSGDDDFWFYVDGELVLDLGGVHSAMAGDINFRTGAVHSARGNSTLYEIFRSNYQARGMSESEISARLSEIFEQKTADGRQVYVFKDYSRHDMKMFYMERGAGASNLHMRFNLASVKPGTVVLSKKLSGAESPSNSLIEFPYQIWYVSKSDGQPHCLTEKTGSDYHVIYKDSTRPVRYQEHLTIPGEVISYDNVFFLKPGESAVIDLPDDAADYWIVECAVNTAVYDRVSANNAVLEPGEGSGTGAYKAFATPPDTLENRPQVDFDNHVRDGAMRTLSITKWLYDVNGTDRLFYPADDTPFSLRLYLGNEYSDPGALPGANLYPYYVKDAEGNYCRWDAAQQKFVSLGIRTYEGENGLSAYLETCTAAQRAAVVFQTSPGGSISKIPTDHSVEVRDLVVGTKWKVEERQDEIPRGYTLRQSDGYQRIDTEPWQNWGTTPVTDVVGARMDPEERDPAVAVSNQKGWGLTVQKVWTDKDFMASHDDVFFAVYLREDGGERLLDDTVVRLKHPKTQVYYFFDNMKMDGHPFSDFIVREVRVAPEPGEELVIRDDDTVCITGGVRVEPIPDGGTLASGGIPVGSETRKDFSYSVAYTVGQPTGHNENIRTDTVTNARPGIRLLKEKWNGEPLANAYFTLKDESGLDVAKASYRSDTDGLITIACLDVGTYTLTEIRTPRGYVGLPGPLEIRVTKIDAQGNPVIEVSGAEGCWQAVQAAGREMATVTVRNRTVGFQAVKVEARSGQPLAGAHFALHLQVTDNQGRKVKADSPVEGYGDIVSGTDGVLPGVDLANLRKDRSMTYYLCETQPAAGHELLGEDICFTVAEDGSVRIESETHVSWLTVESGDSGNMSYLLTIPNESTVTLSFRKVDIADPGHTMLADARFALYRVIGGSPEERPLFPGLSSREDGLLADYAGHTAFELSAGVYQLVELQPPPGYYRKAEPVLITVSDASPPPAGGPWGVSYDEGTNLSASGVSYDETTGVYTLLISNSTGYELPASGGVGALPFRLGGAGLLLTGLLYRFRPRRRRERGDAAL